MQHHIDAIARVTNRGRISHGALDEAKGAWRFERMHVRDVVARAGAKVVKRHHILAELKQSLGQVGTDEAGRTGHEPTLRFRLQHALENSELRYRLRRQAASLEVWSSAKRAARRVVVLSMW